MAMRKNNIIYNKDWTGNSGSIFKQLGASSHSDSEREVNDFYATDPKAIDDLVATGVLNDVLRRGGLVWEPACGQGHMSDRLRELGFRVVASDLIDRGAKEAYVYDFLNGEHVSLFASETEKTMDASSVAGVQAIITNPPYKYATEFILKAKEVLGSDGIICMFLKLTTLEGQNRYEKVWKGGGGLRYVYVYSKRIQCAKNGEFSGSSAVCYAWFVWDKGYEGEPVIRWIGGI